MKKETKQKLKDQLIDAAPFVLTFAAFAGGVLAIYNQTAKVNSEAYCERQVQMTASYEKVLQQELEFRKTELPTQE